MILERTGEVKIGRKNRRASASLVIVPIKNFPKMTASVVGIIIFVWAIYSLANQYLLPIHTLYVTGNIENVDKALLRKAAQDAITQGFFAVDVNAVKETVHDLPWVQNVSVRRIWPDGLHVHIKEQTAVARWGQSKLINELGELFSPNQQITSSELPMILGAEGMHASLFQQLNALQVSLKSTGLTVTKLVYDARHSMQVTLSNNVVLLLGRVRSVEENYAELLRFSDAYRSTLAKYADDIDGIDLRYTNGFAVHWKSSKSPALNDNSYYKLRT